MKKNGEKKGAKFWKKEICHLMFGAALFIAPALSGRENLRDTPAYNQFCLLAARQQQAFHTFKRSPAYTWTIENVDFEHGFNYLDLFLEQSPEWISRLDDFRKNDLIGCPIVYFYGSYGYFSPNTLRYMKIASDLHKEFGSLEGLDIIEVGGGYGGQCMILSQAFQWKSYTIVDLPAPLELTKQYLEAQGVKNVIFLTPEEVPEGASYDLAISNYSFTECFKKTQYDYLDRMLYRAKNGFMLCYDMLDPMSPLYNNTISKSDLVNAFKEHGFSCKIVMEEPYYSNNNYLFLYKK